MHAVGPVCLNVWLHVLKETPSFGVSTAGWVGDLTTRVSTSKEENFDKEGGKKKQVLAQVFPLGNSLEFCKWTSFTLHQSQR